MTNTHQYSDECQCAACIQVRLEKEGMQIVTEQGCLGEIAQEFLKDK